MECPQCKGPYGKESRVPLLLIKCGHSLCETCAAALLSQDAIVCPECKAVSCVDSISQLPKNMALLMMSLTVPLQDQRDLCPVHQKKLEGFCGDDKKLLCINCILLDGHKSHEISPIVKAATEERSRLEKSAAATQQVEDRLRALLGDIAQFRTVLSGSANARREQVAAVYKEIVEVIQERESTLRRDIAAVLEREEEVLTARVKSVEEQLGTIAGFRKEREQAKKESDCELLTRTEARERLATEATRAVVAPTFSASFPEVRKENELGLLWKMLSPSPSKKGSVQTTTAKTCFYNTRPGKSGSRGTQKSRGHRVVSERNKSATTSIMDPQATLDKLMAQGASAIFAKASVAKPHARASAQKVNISLCCGSVNSTVKGSRPEDEGARSPRPVPAASSAHQSPNKLASRSDIEPTFEQSYATIPAAGRTIPRDEISATNSAIAQAAATVTLIHADPFTALREKRERHKKEKLEVMSPTEAQKGSGNMGAPGDFCGAMKAAWCEDQKKEEPERKENEPAPVARVPDEEKEKEKKPETVPVFPQVAGAANIERKQSTSKQTEQTSIAPTLYEMYVGGESEKMSLSTMLAGINEYIYVFCKNASLRPVIAGYNDTGVVACERYDVQKDIWKEVSGLSKAQCKAGAAVGAGDLILLLGGKYSVIPGISSHIGRDADRRGERIQSGEERLGRVRAQDFPGQVFLRCSC